MNFTSTASIIALGAVLGLSACSGEQNTQAPSAVNEKADGAGAEANTPTWPVSEAIDAFTHANYNDVRVTNVDLDLDVLFDEKVLDGTAEIDFERLNADAVTLVLDANDLTIASVDALVNGDWAPTDYTMGPDDASVGSRFEIKLPDGADKVRVAYRTSPEAEGLQWLSPAQTAGKTHPFLFSQNQPFFARTMAPLQDTPAVRMTYSATLRTPPELLALMSARQDEEGVRDGDYTFDMAQPIPSYLLAIVVGDIEFKAINDHIGVYAERDILTAAAEEFEDTPAMEQANAALYGPYRWARYDMMVLPPSFPFGGMENPRLSFLTPTLIAGDKSLTNVVAHELAHSWSGNLVTNATWRDAWLNEGFTSYVENRVMEALYGEERAVMERSLDLASLKRDMADAERPELTALKMPADLGHPDDAFSQVSYAGGMFFLKLLEERFGRDTFDAFVREYFNHFAFQSITTEDFLTYFEKNLWAMNPDAVTKSEIDAWVYEPGLPDTVENPHSDAFENVSAQQAAWLAGGAVESIESAGWTTHEWLHFLNTLPAEMTLDQFTTLDAQYSLSQSQNAETAFAWFMKAIAADYGPAFEPLDAFLMRVGRGKFIYRLYQTLVDNDRRDWATGVYSRARPGYHPIAQRRIDAIFAG